MLYVFFYKGIHSVQWVPQKLWNFWGFVLKETLQSVRLLLTVSYRKKIGEQDVLVAPPIILLAGSRSYAEG